MTQDPILSVRGLQIRFGLRGRTLHAIRDIDLDLYRGEVLALVGESGSGKSVFTKSFMGLLDANGSITGGSIDYYPTPGCVPLHLAALKTEKEWLAVRGREIAMVMQDPMTSLNPLKTIGEQITEAVTLHQGLKGAAAREKTLEYLRDVGIPDPALRYKQYPHEFSGGMRQRVVIAIALACNPKILLCDEPTTALDVTIQAQILQLLRQMRAKYHLTIVLITHKLGEVMDISDRVTILRKGKSVETVNTAESSEKQLTELMVGKAVELSIERPEPVNVKPILNVVDLTVKNSEGSIALDDVSFVINRGEILGVAGIAGSGQKELCETIAGLQKIEKGAVLYNKENIIGKTPKEIINLGISMSFIPEDRLGMGLIASVGMTDNMLLKTYKQGKLCFVDRKPAKALSKELIEKLEIKTPSTELPVRMLSGGNVQKVLLGREIHSEPDLLITAYPVRGLDINSSYLIYSLLNEQKKKNTAVLFIGEDLDVLLELCDRIMVLCHGKITGICDAKKVTKEQVGMMMTGSTMEEVLGIG